MDHNFTEDWFTQHIPIWEHNLASLKDRQINGIELGSFEGRSAIWLTENIFTNDYSTLDCVDEFQGDPNLDLTHDDWDGIKKRFLDNTQELRDEGKIALHQMDSKAYLKGREHMTDFVYVDANHQAVDCLQDAVLAHMLLKKDGIMVFDDYLWDGLDIRPALPKLAIDTFLLTFHDRYKILHMGYQVIIQKLV